MKKLYSKIAILMSILMIASSVFVSFGRELTSDEKAAFIVRDEWVEWVKSFTASLSELDKTATAKIYEDMDFYDMQYRFTEKYKKVPEYLDEDGKPTQKLKDMIKEKRKEINKNRAGGQATTAGIDWDTKYGATNWMKNIPGDRIITDINMAGSAASATGTGYTDTYVQHQSLNVDQLFQAGVRVFDVTINSSGTVVCKKSDGTYVASTDGMWGNITGVCETLHGCVDSGASGKDDTAVVILSCNGTVPAQVLNILALDYAYPITSLTRIPKLSDVRGKVCFIAKDIDITAPSGRNLLKISSTSGSQKLGNVDLYVEAHDGMTVNDKQAQLDIAYNEVNARTVNTDTTKIGKSAIIYTTTNVAGTLTPQAAATTINATLSSHEVSQGNLWGWVMMDYVTSDLAKSINVTNP